MVTEPIFLDIARANSSIRRDLVIGTNHPTLVKSMRHKKPEQEAEIRKFSLCFSFSSIMIVAVLRPRVVQVWLWSCTLSYDEHPVAAICLWTFLHP